MHNIRRNIKFWEWEKGRGGGGGGGGGEGEGGGGVTSFQGVKWSPQN